MVSLVALASATCVAQAAGLGAGSSAAVLGQSLDYAVAVRLDPGEALPAECVSAEVSIGDRRLNAANLRVLVEPAGAEAARVRVLTNQVVDEPVVAVQLTVGCNARVSRRYVVLADPVMPAAASAVTAAVTTASVSPAAMVPAFAAAPPEVPSSAGIAAGTAAGSALAAPAALRAPARGATATGDGEAVVQERSVRRVAMRAAATTRAQRRAEARAESQRARRRAAAPSAEAPRRAQAATSGPRLKLDYAPPLMAAGPAGSAVDQALEAVAQAAANARQQAQAASAAAERIAALERTVESLRGEAKSNRDLSAQLSEQLVRTDAAASWTWPLAAAAVTLGTLATWLALRLAAARREQQKAWHAASLQAHRARLSEEGEATAGAEGDEDAESRAFGAGSRFQGSRLPGASQAAPTAPVPFVSSVLDHGQGSAGRLNASPAWPPPSDSGWMPDRAMSPAPAPRPAPAPEPQRLRVVSSAPAPLVTPRPSESLSPTQATVALSSLNNPLGHAARDMSIEELLDLEQQAEFFVVLGQDEAAIDLLVEHLRNTGGGSPLPYLKLLEIYRRRGDRSDYERTRARFNHRFNAYAPDWEVDLQSGRSLTDYPEVLPRLQAVWSRPLDSMAELEALLFRKLRGELFDLPAYREVLFLYGLARDLLDRESAATGMVDLLLPLNDATDPRRPAAADSVDQGGDAMPGHHDFEDRPTAPVDLDLSFDSDRPASIFDPLEAPAPQPRRR